MQGRVSLQDLGVIAASLMACGKSGAVKPDGGIVERLRACPTTGAGAMEGDVCFVVSPDETGLSPGGVDATVDP